MRILWAVDPFERFGNTQRFAAEALEFFIRKRQAVVEPVYALKIHPDLVSRYTTQWMPQYRLSIEEKILELIHRLGKRLTHRAVLPPRVILHETLFTREAVRSISDYALNVNADLIVANTHGKSGLRSLLLGSFAEMLLDQSEVPVLLIRHESRKWSEMNRILFPTDFGIHAELFFKRALELSKMLASRLTVFHSIVYPIEPLMVSSAFTIASPWKGFPNYMKGESERALKIAQNWRRLSEKAGIKMDFHLDTSGQNIWSEIVKAATKDQAGLIAMESHSGPLSSAFIGSTTRQVIRHANCPVWILKHPQSRSKKAA